MLISLLREERDGAAAVCTFLQLPLVPLNIRSLNLLEMPALLNLA